MQRVADIEPDFQDGEQADGPDGPLEGSLVAARVLHRRLGDGGEAALDRSRLQSLRLGVEFRLCDWFRFRGVARGFDIVATWRYDGRRRIASGVLIALLAQQRAGLVQSAAGGAHFRM